MMRRADTIRFSPTHHDFKEEAVRMKRISPLGVLCVALLAASSVRAQAPVEKIDVQNSRVYVFVAKKGAGHEHGVEGRIAAGTLRLGQAAAAGDITFDLRSFQADTDDARNYVGLKPGIDASTQADVTANMHGASVLDVARQGVARFAVDSIRPAVVPGFPGPAYQFDGELDLHGTKRKLGFLASVEMLNDGRRRIRGRFALKQTDFGIQPFSKFLGAVGVADEVQVYGDIYLTP
jgi:polyisoprenoid-binding protein YceI